MPDDLAEWERPPEVRVIREWLSRSVEHAEAAAMAYQPDGGRSAKETRVRAGGPYSAEAVLRVGDEEAILAFRGTTGLRDWIQNAKLWPNAEAAGGRVHRGFQQALDTIWPSVVLALDELGDLPVSYTGHSLGGALATIAAARRAPRFLTTFGAPRVGDSDFNATVRGETWFRVVNRRDIVANQLPPDSLPLMRYTHAGRLIFHDGAGIMHQFADAREIPASLFEKPRQTPAEPSPTRSGPSEPFTATEYCRHYLPATRARPPHHSPQIVPWLKASIRALPPPFLYELARRIGDADPEEAAVWFWLGGMRTRYDAERCLDKSVRGVIAVLPSSAENVQALISANSDLRTRAIRRALDWERQMPEATSPDWLIGHGIGAYGGLTPQSPSSLYVPGSEWAAIRDGIRRRFEDAMTAAP